jgi:hypothetical protein
MKLTLVKPSDVQKAADEANKTASSPVASPAKP